MSPGVWGIRQLYNLGGDVAKLERGIQFFGGFRAWQVGMKARHPKPEFEEMVCTLKRYFFSWQVSFLAHGYHLTFPWTLLLWNSSWATFSLRYTAHAQSASGSTAHERLFSPGMKSHLTHCSSTLMESRLFRKVTFQPPFRQCSRNQPLEGFLSKLKWWGKLSLVLHIEERAFG